MKNNSSHSVRVSAVADCCNGKIIGNGELLLSNIASLDNVTPESLSFIVSSKKWPKATAKEPGAIIVRQENADQFTCTKIIVRDPYLAYAQATALFSESGEKASPTIHSSAIIDDSVCIGNNVEIGPYVSIKAGSRVGDDVKIDAHVSIGKNSIVGNNTSVEAAVVIGDRCAIGERCTISPGVVIGGSGFGYAEDNQQWIKIHQLGGVLIGDDVDIGANTTIDRGAIDNTVIGDRVKLDNQIQIAHNVQVGNDTIMAGCVAIAGSTSIGKRCQLGGRVSVLGHLEIVDDVLINAGTFVAQSIESAGTYSSMVSAQPVSKWRKIAARINQLDRLARKINVKQN